MFKKDVNIRNLREYRNLNRLTSLLKSPNKHEESLGIWSKAFDIKSNDVEMLFRMIRIEKKINDSYKINRYERGCLIGSDLAFELIEMMSYFGIKCSMVQGCITILDEDHAGEYDGHNDYIYYYIRNDFKCRKCSASITEYNKLCTVCKEAEHVQKRDIINQANCREPANCKRLQAALNEIKNLQNQLDRFEHLGEQFATKTV